MLLNRVVLVPDIRHNHAFMHSVLGHVLDVPLLEQLLEDRLDHGFARVCKRLPGRVSVSAAAYEGADKLTEHVSNLRMRHDALKIVVDGHAAALQREPR